MTLKLARKVTAEEVNAQWRKLTSTYGKIEVKMASGKALSQRQTDVYKNLYFLSKYVEHKIRLPDLTKCDYTQNQQNFNVNQNLPLSSDNGINIEECISDSQDVKPNIEHIQMEEIIVLSDDENNDPIYENFKQKEFNNEEEMCEDVIIGSQDSIANELKTNIVIMNAVNNRVQGKSTNNSSKGKSIIRENTSNLQKTSLKKPSISSAISDLNVVVSSFKQNQIIVQYASIINQHLLKLKNNKFMALLQVLKIIEGFKTK